MRFHDLRYNVELSRNHVVSSVFDCVSLANGPLLIHKIFVLTGAVAEDYDFDLFITQLKLYNPVSFLTIVSRSFESELLEKGQGGLI